MTFTERVLKLIERDGITKNKMLTDLKLAKGSFGNWQERGTIPNGETLSKIADYFGVTIDYLLGATDQKEKPLSRADKGITDDDIKFALFSGSDHITDEMYEEVKQFAEFVKQKYKK